MPTQRPFLSTFLAAFRAHSQPHPKAQPSVAAQTQTIWTSATSATPKSISTTSSSENLASPRPINPKATHAYTTSASAALAASANHEKQLHPALQHNVSPSTHLPRSTPSPGLPVYGPQNKPQPNYPVAGTSNSRRTRRGSDSSSDSGGGFREVNGGGEKWFVGGRTAAGEERYYKLSMVKRDRSSDRISADQLSL